jgi:predicted kinase
MIRVRSDVERKRLLGLAPADRTGAGVGRGPYSAAATARTYAVLRRRADRILHAGYSAVVDASFLRRAQRRPFARLARRRGCAFRVIACQAPAALLRRLGSDAGSAGAADAEVPAAVRRRGRPDDRARHAHSRGRAPPAAHPGGAA